MAFEDDQAGKSTSGRIEKEMIAFVILNDTRSVWGRGSDVEAVFLRQIDAEAYVRENENGKLLRIVEIKVSSGQEKKE